MGTTVNSVTLSAPKEEMVSQFHLRGKSALRAKRR